MSELFSENVNRTAPLPGRMRPRAWEDFLGQTDVVKRLRDRPLHSMVLYGPPGCGKTSLARIIASQSDNEFRELSAVSSGVKEVRAVISEGQASSQTGKPVVLFIDEIHRFSKSQQDALLQAVESGWIILIGATTENPSFEIIGPLLSRCQVYRLLPLEDSDLYHIVENAFARDVSLAGLQISEDAKAVLSLASGGDARKLLRWLDIVVDDFRAKNSESQVIQESDVKNVLNNSVRRYDKLGDNHYDYISALIKSMRGSDPDAALLYMSCMIDGGEDPLFIARRMIIFASEDVGNAWPEALVMATSAFQALERIGMPEGRIVLGQLATYLASVPKSNAAYNGINEALRSINNQLIQVPNHLRNAPTATHRKEGASLGYKYPHDFPGSYVEQQYLPDTFNNKIYYRPSDQGMEAKFKERLKRLRPERYRSD